MRNIFLMSLVGLLCFIQGCAMLLGTTDLGGSWIYVDVNTGSILSPLPEEVGYEKNYKIGEEKTAFIGQEIIQVKAYTKERATYQDVTARQDLSIDARYGINNYQIRINKNDKYPTADKVDVKGQTFYLIRLSGNNSSWGILMDVSGGILKNGIYSYNYQMIYYPNSIVITPDNFKFSIQEKIIDTRITAGLSFDLIYSGKNDVSINTTYREYTSDNLARPAFFQNLTYQANAKQVRFKEFVIQIHDISNEKITYTILADGLK